MLASSGLDGGSAAVGGEDRALSGVSTPGPRQAARIAGCGAFNPRLQAAVAVLSVRNLISRRDTVELVEQLWRTIATGLSIAHSRRFD
jgi:hypothetical protein